MGLISSIKKVVKAATGNSGNSNAAQRKAVKLASAGANEDIRKKMALRKAKKPRPTRGQRGRESTIITPNSEIQSRTMLG